MQLLAQLLGQQSSGGNTPPAGETLVCTISGAGTSAVNGDYYTDANNPSAVAKHVSNNYWIRISQINMGTPYFDYYSYVISNNPTGGTNYYEWYCIDSLNASAGHIRPIGSGSGSNTICTRSSNVQAVVYHAGSNIVNGVYLTHYSNGATAKHAFNDFYLCGTLGPPDYGVLAPNDYGTSPYYLWNMSSSIPLTAISNPNGATPLAIIYN